MSALEDPFGSDGPPAWDAVLGTAAQLLHQRGHVDAVLVLLEVQHVSMEWLDWSVDFSNKVHAYRYYFYVSPSVIDDLTNTVEEQIKDALNLILRPRNEHCAAISLSPAITQSDWRSDLTKALAGKPSNQATLVALPNRYPTKDKMRFRDGGELRVYEALVRAQQRLPNRDTLTIVPNPSVRVPGHTWEPDFLVAYNKRVGVIEVDGSTHHNRWAADKTKDERYEDAGFAYIARIPVEDTNDPKALDEHVDRFLNRLLN